MLIMLYYAGLLSSGDRFFYYKVLIGDLGVGEIVSVLTPLEH
jgi:hypothetical protein